MDFITNTISWIIKTPLICIGWIIVGIVAGALARRIMGSKDRPLINDMILGLLGAAVGGIIAPLIGLGTSSGGLTEYLTSIVIATIGAIVLIAIGRVIRGRR